MKWKEVKILCVGMCVCTVIATGTAIMENAKDKNQLAEAVEQESKEYEMEAGVERHEVHGVGMGTGELPELTEATGSAFSLRGDIGEENDDLSNDNESLLEVGTLNEQQTALESNLIIADVTNYVNIRSVPS